MVETSHNRKAIVHYLENIADGKRPIVFLHGLGASADVWCETFSKLSQQYHSYAIDLPGHGLSSRDFPDESYTTEGMARIVCDLISSKIREKVVLVASSAGGTVGIKIAVERPDLLERLILISPAGISSEVSTWLRTLSIYPLGEILLSRFAIGVIEALMSKNIKVVNPSYSKELVQKNLYFYKLFGTKRAVLKCLRSVINYSGFFKPYTAEELQSITVPVLVIWGENDGVVPVHHTLVANEQIPNSTVVIIRDSKHAPYLDSTSIFCKLIVNFLETEYSPNSENRIKSQYIMYLD